MKFVKPLCVIYSSYPNCLMQIRNEKKKKRFIFWVFPAHRQQMLYMLKGIFVLFVDALDLESQF